MTFGSPYLRKLWQGVILTKDLLTKTEVLGVGEGILKTRGNCSSGHLETPDQYIRADGYERLLERERL
jgi:hypothetical protein